MAQSKPLKQQFTDDDLIQCGICHVDIEHPRSLACLHTYCLACLREWSKNGSHKDKIICPLCREATPLPSNGVDGLRSNFLITKLKERKAVLSQLMDKDVKIVCTACDDGNAATGRCLDCDDFLCESCFKAHTKMKLMKHHSVLTLVELRSGEVLLTQKKFKEDYCNEHKGQVFWFFCKTCKVPICRDCTVVEHPTGIHDVVKLENVVSDQKEEISRFVDRCKDVKLDVDKALVEYEISKIDLSQNCAAATKQIKVRKKEVKTTLLTSLEQEEVKLLKGVDQLKNSKEKALSVHKEELQTLQCRLRTALEMAEKVSKEGSSCDVAAAHKPLTTTLKQLGQLKCPSYEVGKIKFIKQSSLTSSTSFIGKIEAANAKKVVMKEFQQQKYNMEQWNSKWEMVKKIGDDGFTVFARLKDPRGVAINADGDIAVADCNASGVNIYDIDYGRMKMKVDTTHTHSLVLGTLTHKSSPHGIALNSTHYIITDQAYYPTVYDVSGKYVTKLSMSKYKENHSMGIAINSKNQVLVGHPNASQIGVYDISNGNHISSLSIPHSGVRYIAVSSDDSKIIVNYNSWVASGSCVIDPKGRHIHDLRPPTDMVAPSSVSWIPSGVCTIGEGDDEEVFVCNTGQPKGIFRFSLSTGRYLGCVTTSLTRPQGIAFTDDVQLVVADNKSIKIFAPSEKYR